MAKTFFHWLQLLLKVKVQLAMPFICYHPSTIMTVVIIFTFLIFFMPGVREEML